MEIIKKERQIIESHEHKVRAENEVVSSIFVTDGHEDISYYLRYVSSLIVSEPLEAHYLIDPAGLVYQILDTKYIIKSHPTSIIIHLTGVEYTSKQRVALEELLEYLDIDTVYHEHENFPPIEIPDISDIFTLIRDWSEERGLDKLNSMGQIVKLGEEFGELCEAFLKHDTDGLQDAIGDMVIVLTILAQQQKIDIEDCILYAYNEIKDRKGKVENGTFHKDTPNNC